MANNLSGVVDDIQKISGKENFLPALFDFLSKNDPEIATIQKEFKRKYLLPMLRTWEKFRKDLEKNSNKTSDVFTKLDEVFTNLKEGTSTIVSKQQEKINSTLETIKEAYSKNILPPLVENEKKENLIENKDPLIQKQNLNNLIQNEPVNKRETFIEENKPEIQSIPVNNREKLIEENKQETVISFSTQTNDFLSKLMDKIIEGQKENLENLELQRKQQGIGGIIGELFKGLPLLLTALGGATALAGMFWPEIKKFINEKFGDKAAEVFDKFQGTVNAIGKFLTVGGLQMTVGKTFKTLGDLLGNVADNFAKTASNLFTGMIDNLLGVGVKTGAVATGKAIGQGLLGTLSKGASILLKGVSKTALKAIPLIGSVISFADAWGRFKEGEYAQGMIDIGAGLAAFVPGIGTALSIGLSVMNAIIDFKSPEEKEKLTQQTIDISSFLLKGVGFFAKLGKPFLKGLPLIGSLLSFGSALDNFKNENIMAGAMDMVSGIAALFPGVGTAISLGLDVLNSFMSSKTETGKTRFEAVGDWFGKIWDWIKKTKPFKVFSDLFSGIKAVLSGDFKSGISYLKSIPILGDVVNFFSKEETNTPKPEKPPEIDGQTASSIKNIPIKYDVEEEQKKTDELKNIEKRNEELEKELAELNNPKTAPLNRAEAATKNSKISQIKKEKESLLKTKQEVEEQLKRFSELKENQPETVHADDISTETSLLPVKKDGFSYQPSSTKNFNSGKMVFLNKDDSLTSFKKDGPIDNAFQTLTQNIQQLTQKMSNIADEIKVLASQQNNNQTSQPIVVNNSSIAPSPATNFNPPNSMDEIFMSRIDYLRNNPYNRPVIR